MKDEGIGSKLRRKVLELGGTRSAFAMFTGVVGITSNIWAFRRVWTEKTEAEMAEASLSS